MSKATPQDKIEQGSDPELEFNRIRRMLQLDDFQKASRELKAMGPSANLAYVKILLDKQANSQEITRIFSLVGRQSGDRSEFVHLAAGFLSDKDEGVRAGAASLLGKIGKSDHAPAIARMLTDDSGEVQTYAAEALVRIGTAKELDEFDRRLSVKHSADYPELLEDLKQRRNRFKKRLEASKK